MLPLADSEDSRESAVERWLETGGVGGDAYSAAGATTAYESARETSVEREEFVSASDSSDDWCFLFDDEKGKYEIPKALPFPSAMPRTLQRDRTFQFAKNVQVRALDG